MGKRILTWLLALLVLAGVALAEGEINSKAMLNEPGRKIGISQGSAAEEAVASEFPEAAIVYYTDNLLGFTAVAQGKLDAYVYDLVQMQLTIDNGLTGAHLLPEVMDTTVKIAVGYSDVSAIPDLGEKLNRFIAEVKADGTLDDMYRRWVMEGNSIMPEIPMPESPQVHLTVGTTGSVPPYSYYEGSGLTGYDIELAHRFAAWLGADLSFQIYDFDGIIPAAKSGKIDVIMSNLQYLPERSEELPFSDILYEEKMGIMVKGDAPATDAAPTADAAPAYAAYNGKRIGVLTGPLMEDVARETFPDSETLLFNSYPDCITALLTGKIDAYLGDELGVKAVHMEQPEIDYIRERITENNYSFAFRKDDPESAALCEELNAFLAKCWADGTMDELDDIWFGEDEARKVVDMSDLTGENGAIKVVTTSTDPPFSYIKDGKNVGYDIDLVARFCRDRGYALELGDVDFAGRIPAIESGKYDFTTDMNVTPEREEEVLFSDPVCKGGIVLAVRASDLKDSSTDSAVGEYQHPEDLVGKRIAVQTGTISGEVAQAIIGDVQLDYYNSQIDAMTALRSNKADAWATDEPVARYLLIENTDLVMVEEKLDDSSLAAVFAKTDAGQVLCEQYSAFVDSLWADGTMAEIDAIWFGTDVDKRTVLDYENLPDTNGTLRMAVDTSIIPFAFMKANCVMGYDVDIAARFCEANGYRLEVVPMSFDGVLPSVLSGKVDFAATGITVTEERAESVLFSSKNYKSGTVLVVRKDEATMATERAAAYTSLSQLNGKRIGVQTGTTFDEIVLEALPDAQISYFNSYPDMAAALEANKIDGFPGDEPVLQLMAAENNKLAILADRMDSFEFGFVLPKTDAGEALLAEFNAWLAEIKASGELDEVIAKWTSGAEADKIVPDYSSYPAPNGTLTMATEGAYAPMNYYRGNEVVGLEVDLATRFCEANGYGLNVEAMNFDGILPAVQAGKVDFAAAGITITEERAESVNFSTPYYTGGTVMAVLKGEQASAAEPGLRPELTTFSDLSGKTVSMLTGAPFEELVRSKAPEVGEFTTFNNMPDMLLALKSGKTDAVLINNAIAALAVNRDPDLALFPKNLQDGAFGFAFAKGDPRRDAWQAAFNAIPEARIQAAWDKWTGADESAKVLPEQDWPGLNGTVRVAACDTLEPMSYVGGDGELMGFDLEVILMTARELDVRVEFTGMEFAAILTSVQSGKADIGAGSIIITDERAESVDFVEYHPAAFVLIVRATRAAYEAGAPITAFSDLENGRIGATTGSVQVLQVEERFPNAELFYFSTNVDMLEALRAHKIDAFAEPEPIVRYMMTENKDLTCLDERLGDGMQVGAVFPKTDEGQALCDEFSAFIRQIRQNGVYDEIQDTWFGEDEAKRVVPDLYDLPATNGTLRMAVDTSLVPFVYVKDGKPVGLDIDTAVRFCKASGYGLEVVPMDFSGVIPAVTTGKVDFACSGIAYTPERAQSVLYSEPTYESTSVIAVLKAQELPTAVGAEEDTSFWGGIKASFHKTFIRESRWKLFVDGILTTLLITALAILFGTLLGFTVFMLCRNGNPVANLVTRFCLWLVQGMPMVVLLMILYYIIFGSIAISGIAVAVLGFTLTFGASVFGLLKMGVGAVDNGQYEAAYALGYSNRRTFFKIILPQALPHVLPAYRGEIVGLIKATAIVGYIAVQDLTKMGDIVRSRTYEAFFPLIAVTVIYFVLEGLIGFLVSRISVNFNPKRRKPADILKGVKTDD